jgi:hypothetical protein
MADKAGGVLSNLLKKLPFKSPWKVGGTERGGKGCLSAAAGRRGRARAPSSPPLACPTCTPRATRVRTGCVACDPPKSAPPASRPPPVSPFSFQVTGVASTPEFQTYLTRPGEYRKHAPA